MMIKMYRVNGELKTIHQLAKDYSLPEQTLRTRLTKLSLEEALGPRVRRTDSDFSLPRHRYPREYKSYQNSLARCNYSRHRGYPRYGGRGIKFLYKNFDEFFADVGPRPEGRWSIDRIDVNGNYQRGNCRWATAKTQNLNKTNNLYITYECRTQPAAAWCEELGLRKGAIGERYNAGLPLDQVFRERSRINEE